MQIGMARAHPIDSESPSGLLFFVDDAGVS